MSDLNQFSCTGRLGADPESRTFPRGDHIVNLRVAVSEQWRDKNSGEKREKTLWLPVSITNQGLCKVAEGYLKKGARVALSGKLETETWEKDGQTHYKTVLSLGPYNSTLTMLDAPSGNRDSGQSSQSSQPRQSASVPPSFDDDMPF